MYADIHLYLYFYYSTLSIKDIVIKAVENNISLISKCDHHSIECYTNIKIY
jgi:hypothetical protein